MAKAANAAALDFTNVKDGGGSFNKKRQPEGDYRAKVTKVEDVESKADKTPMWLFTIEVGTGTYAYYCKHVENQLWKIRNLLVAAGISVPKKRVKVDPNRVVGKYIGVTLEDDEYEGKLQSNIAAVFPASELDSDGDDDDDDVDTDEVEAEDEAEEAEDEVEEEAEVEDEESDDDPLAALDRTGLKALIKEQELEVKVLKSMSDDDIRAAITAASATTAEDDDDELEEIEIEDI